MTSTSVPWRIVLYIGAAECIWLGVCMVLSPWYKVAPALFSPIDPTYVIPVGIICVIAGIVGFIRPDVMGGGALLLCCGLRITQSFNVKNPYPVGVWLILIGALLAVYLRFRMDTSIGGVSIRNIMENLERRAVQQSEERERQTREGERQTTEAQRQTRESDRQTREGERLRSVRINEGNRQTTEGDRQTTEGDRQTREGERQTAEGEHLADLRIKLDDERKESR